MLIFFIKSISLKYFKKLWLAVFVFTSSIIIANPGCVDTMVACEDGVVRHLKFKVGARKNDVAAVAMKYPFLQSLDISCSSVSRSTLATILLQCLELKTLNISFCPRLTRFCRYLPENSVLPLEAVDVSYSQATDDEIALLISNCLALKRLTLAGCKGVADFVWRLPYDFEFPFTHLHLAHTDATAVEVAAIVARSPHLQKLSLAGCRGAGYFINYLSQSLELPFIWVDLSETGVTEEEVAAIRLQSKRLEDLLV